MRGSMQLLIGVAGRRMASVISTAVLMASIGALAQAAPTVSNVRASQRMDGSKKVDIYYDLTGGAGMMIVHVIFSTDNGASFTLIPQDTLLSGDVGTNVANGTDKHIVWDAAADVPESYFPQARA